MGMEADLSPLPVYLSVCQRLSWFSCVEASKGTVNCVDPVVIPVEITLNYGGCVIRQK